MKITPPHPPAKKNLSNNITQTNEFLAEIKIIF